jgi:hypothetical protein
MNNPYHLWNWCITWGNRNNYLRPNIWNEMRDVNSQSLLVLNPCICMVSLILVTCFEALTHTNQFSRLILILKLL